MICKIPVELSAVVLLIPTLSLMTACLAWFIQYTLKPGEIFGRYGLWLTAVWMRNWRKKDRYKRALLPPLGLCPYCNSVWLGTAFYTVACYLLPIPWWLAAYGWPLFVGAQYVWVKLLAKHLE